MKNEQADFESLVPGRDVNRRTFLVTSLGAGFALAVQPGPASAMISTSDSGLVAGEVRIPVRDGEMVAYHARPADKPKAPVVLVVSEIFGVHEYIKDTARRLAKAGFHAIAPELFARQGDPRKYTSIPELQANITSKTPDAQVMSDLDATVAWAAKQGADTDRLAITGFCWGGRITWLYAAHNPQLKAGVAWYGRLVGNSNEFTPRQPVDVAGDMKAPVLGLYGGLDTGIPLESVEQMEARLKAGSQAARLSQIHVYDNAPHAFHADYRPSYRKEDAEDGWKRMLEWFAKIPT
jgi:carboxymethylenebutenolidase